MTTTLQGQCVFIIITYIYFSKFNNKIGQWDFCVDHFGKNHMPTIFTEYG